MDKKIKYFSNKAKSVEGEDRVLRFIGSTETIDRDNEKILASGWKLENYKKNPVVLVNHQYAELPVAKTKNVWIEDKKLMFDIEFPEPDVSSVGDTLFKLYKNGFMNATSVGFQPNHNKIEYGKTVGEPRATYKEQELLEISLVSVPANPTALLTSKSIQKAVSDDIVDEIEIQEVLDFIEKIYSKEEKTEKNENLEQINDETIINNSEKNFKCKSCGVELRCYCDECQSKEDRKEFFAELEKIFS